MRVAYLEDTSTGKIRVHPKDVERLNEQAKDWVDTRAPVTTKAALGERLIGAFIGSRLSEMVKKKSRSAIGTEEV